MRSLVLVLAVSTLLSGCSVLAAPCRLASAGLRAIPLIGAPVSAATDACANLID
ncbi:hypothetical protein D3C71_25530 [compost metagenome]